MCHLCLQGQPADWKGADHHCRPVRDPTLQLQGVGREPVRRRFRVHQSHADVRVPPSGVRGRGAMSESGFHEATVHTRGDLQNAVLWLGFTRRVRHQKGILGEITGWRL